MFLLLLDPIHPSIHPSCQGLYLHVVSAIILPQRSPYFGRLALLPLAITQLRAELLCAGGQEATDPSSAHHTHTRTSSYPPHWGYSRTTTVGTRMRCLSSECVVSSSHQGVLKQGATSFIELYLLVQVGSSLSSPALLQLGSQDSHPVPFTTSALCMCCATEHHLHHRAIVLSLEPCAFQNEKIIYFHS